MDRGDVVGNVVGRKVEQTKLVRCLSDTQSHITCSTFCRRKKTGCIKDIGIVGYIIDIEET